MIRRFILLGLAALALSQSVHSAQSLQSAAASPSPELASSRSPTPLSPCLIVGDSIAVGIAMFAPHCQSMAVGGWTSRQWNKRFLSEPATETGKKPLQSDRVVISLGTNDHQYVKTDAELLRLRSNIQASNVVWILPANNLPASQVSISHIRNTVSRLARLFGDQVVAISHLQKDGLHPSDRGYRLLVQQAQLVS